MTCYNQWLYRVKKKQGLRTIRENRKENYSKLFKYVHAILTFNFGFTISVDRDWLRAGVNLHFMRFFMFFDANRKEFFKRCRQFIGVNGYFLKGLYKGMLLSATNYAIYPLAVCLVDNGNIVLGILHGDIV